MNEEHGEKRGKKRKGLGCVAIVVSERCVEGGIIDDRRYCELRIAVATATAIGGCA